MNIGCQMVGAEIPRSLCESEQGSTLCSGCKAMTRRCVECGKAAGITFPLHGLCSACAHKRGITSDRANSRLPGGSSAVALEGAVAAVRAISVDADVVSLPKLYRQKAEEKLVVPSLTKEHGRLVALFGEHAQRRGDSWFVKEPLRILLVRAKFLPDEGKQVLSDLVSAGYLVGVEPWSTAELKQAPALAAGDGEDVSDGPGADAPREYAPRRTVAYRGPRMALPPQQPVLQELVENISTVSPVVQSAGRTFTEIYAYLLGKAMVIRGERLVRGAVPMVATEYRTSPASVVTAFEHLLSAGHIAQRGGWGAIVLLRDKLEDNGVAIAPPAPRDYTRRATMAGNIGAQTRPQASHSSVPHLRVIEGEGASLDLAPNSTVVARNSGQAADSLDDLIDEVEQRLPELRSIRDQVAAKVSTLEINLATLKACREQVSQTSESVASALRESEVATAELLALLRKGK